jgi:hypothetical protein
MSSNVAPFLTRLCNFLFSELSASVARSLNTPLGAFATQLPLPFGGGPISQRASIGFRMCPGVRLWERAHDAHHLDKLKLNRLVTALMFQLGRRVQAGDPTLLLHDLHGTIEVSGIGTTAFPAQRCFGSLLAGAFFAFTIAPDRVCALFLELRLFVVFAPFPLVQVLALNTARSRSRSLLASFISSMSAGRRRVRMSLRSWQTCCCVMPNFAAMSRWECPSTQSLLMRTSSRSRCNFVRL